MTAAEWTFAVLLAGAGALITTGFALIHISVGFIVGGILLAIWGWFVLADSTPTPTPEADL